MIGSTLLLIRSLIQNGANPKPATQAMRQITATLSSQVASVNRTFWHFVDFGCGVSVGHIWDIKRPQINSKIEIRDF